MSPNTLIVVLLAFAVGLVPGWLLGRYTGAWAALAWAALLVFTMFGLMAMGRLSVGFNGLAYSAGAIMMLAPAAFGALVGGGASLLVKRKP
ncbi:hypothetical protein LCM17_07420 [Cereibacter sphaeroides]|nr:hypothetical protein [Cereibacter sphaeroides]